MGCQPTVQTLTGIGTRRPWTIQAGTATHSFLSAFSTPIFSPFSSISSDRITRVNYPDCNWKTILDRIYHERKFIQSQRETLIYFVPIKMIIYLQKKKNIKMPCIIILYCNKENFNKRNFFLLDLIKSHHRMKIHSGFRTNVRR